MGNFVCVILTQVIKMQVLDGMNTIDFLCTENSVKKQLLYGSHLTDHWKVLVEIFSSTWVTATHSHNGQNIYKETSPFVEKQQYNASYKECYNSASQY